MIVIFDYQLYELDLPFLIFESYKKKKPDFVVELVEITQSCYKKILHAYIKDIEDYSLYRNLQALNN